ncbi:hemagglutinin repeat-containing protein, partial [Vibrio sp. M250220]|uniref:hemagglutinin repeat-containing protein n=1 Tax=Vibrio sp. M250220 TaxID=3020894 RepID=UPI002F3E1F9B
QALQKSTKKLKQAEQDYKQYKKGLDSLESTLATLEQEYADKKPGVTFADIEELRDLIAQVESDEAWYIAGVALATEDVVSKTTGLTQQTAALATSVSSCTYCFGFNAGLQLDIEASKNSSSSQQTTSTGSTLSGQNIVITAGNNEGDQLNIQGSQIAANDGLSLAANEINLTASKDTLNIKSEMESGQISAQMTVFGASTGINVNASYNRNQSTSASTTHNNTLLSGDTISLTSNQDTNIKGATVTAESSLEANIGGDLNIASVQDRYTSNSQGAGISGGVSLTGGQTSDGTGSLPQGVLTSMDGAGELTGTNGGINASNGRTSSKQTVLTSLTSGGDANITVGGNTDVTGALIATIDEQGNDIGKLNLTTDSLTYADLSNTHYSQNQSLAVNAGYGIKQPTESGSEPAQSTPNNTSKDDSKFNSSSYQYTNTSSYDKGKTLATIGQGTLTISDSEASNDLTALNRDTEQTEKDLFKVDRIQGNVDVTVDHRLLTEEGRNQIAEDILITDMFRESFERAITTERVGITDFFDETGKQLNIYNAVKQSIADDPSLAAKLQDPDLTAETKEQMLDQLTHAAIKSLGYDAEGYGNKIIAKDDDVRQGFYSEETGDSYINDHNIYDTEGLVNVAGHEMSHAIDDQSGDVNKYSKQDRETYAENIGSDFVDYTDTALGVNGYGSMASTNNHVGNSGKTVTNNNTVYDQLDKNNGDNAIPLIVVGGIALELIDKGITAYEAYKLEEALSEGRTDEAKELATDLGVGFATEAIPGNKIAIKVVGAVKDADKADTVKDLNQLSKIGDDISSDVSKITVTKNADSSAGAVVESTTKAPGTGGTDKSVGDLANAPPEVTIAELNPTEISFSQATVAYQKKGAALNYDELVQSMRRDGWQGEPIDVVKMPDGAPTSADNTRILAAREAGISVKAKIRNYDEAISPEQARRFKLDGELPKTWGEAIEFRVKKQAQMPNVDKTWSETFPNGSIYDPDITR